MTLQPESINVEQSYITNDTPFRKMMLGREVGEESTAAMSNVQDSSLPNVFHSLGEVISKGYSEPHRREDRGQR